MVFKLWHSGAYTIGANNSGVVIQLLNRLSSGSYRRMGMTNRAYLKRQAC